jgi:hypothetical protein
MSIFGFLKRSKTSLSQGENQPVISSDNVEKPVKVSQDEKLDLILAELRALSAVFVQHDQHLTTVDNNLLSRINELMERKKEIPNEKKAEAENIIRKSSTRAEAIEKLEALGISQATAYRYTESFDEDKKKALAKK